MKGNADVQNLSKQKKANDAEVYHHFHRDILATKKIYINSYFTIYY